MGALARFEAFVESLLEGSFAKLAQGSVEPVLIAKQIERAMEDDRRVGPGKVFVPNRFTVALNPIDHERLLPAAPGLVNEMVAYAVNLAHERGYSFLGRVEVLFTTDESMPRRVAHVAGQIVAGLSGQPSTPVADTPAVERTQALNLARLQGAVVATPPAAFTILRDGNESFWQFDSEVLTIGRALDNDLVVEDAAVSRHHAEIRRQYGRYYLTDLQSTNGTTMNGRRVAGSFLRDGDRIRIGDVELVFQMGRADSGEE